MLRDLQWVLSDQQAPTTVAGSPFDSTNIFDTGNLAGLSGASSTGDLGKGELLYFVISVNTTVTSAGAATVQVKLLTDDSSGFGSAVTLFDSGAIAKATLVAGYTVFAQRLPIGCKRYLKVTYTVGTADLTAGKFDAYLTRNIDIPGTLPLQRAVYPLA